MCKECGEKKLKKTSSLQVHTSQQGRHKKLRMYGTDKQICLITLTTPFEAAANWLLQ